jgi:amidase
VSIVPTLEEALARTESRDHQIRAFVHKRLDDARRIGSIRATEAPRTVLHGLPYGLKDLWDTAGIPTTGCSHRYKDRVPAESSPVHRVFEDAGCVLLGKTNASDLGMAQESQSYVCGTTNNPHDLSRTAGGSSGGAAAAVADGMVAFDWGSDFGGSIRMPAAFCGVHGLRLSSEAWPVVGHFPHPPDSVHYMNGQGPITKSLDLMRKLLRTAAPTLRTGKTRSFSLRGVLPWAPTGSAMGMWPRFAEEVEPILSRAISVERRSTLPTVSRAAYIARAMFASHFEDFLESDTLGWIDGFVALLSSLALRGRLFGDRRIQVRTAEVLLLMSLGRITLFRDRRKAEREAALFRDEVNAVFERGLAIALPVTTFSAPPHGRAILNWNLGTCTMPGNVADVTGLAVPFGVFSDGLPRAIQIWGPPGSEESLIDLAERLHAPAP